MSQPPLWMARGTEEHGSYRNETCCFPALSVLLFLSAVCADHLLLGAERSPGAYISSIACAVVWLLVFLCS
jgi:hypothetical protein